MIPLDLSKHPCFSDSARHTWGRLHLPVAAKCNIQCNFCNRRYDCMNESRPGVTSVVLSPRQALDYVRKVMERDPRIAVVGIAGPGDPFANADETLETLRLVRGAYPDMLLCVASNGLNVPPCVDALAEIGVSHVTLTVNAVDPEIGTKIYAWVRDGRRVYRGIPAAELLWQRQSEAIERLSAQGVVVKINAIIIPGVNDSHVEQVAEAVKTRGATILNAIPIYPVAGTPFAAMPEPSTAEVEAIRTKAGKHLSLMRHCTRCRADSVGMLGDTLSLEQIQVLRGACETPLAPSKERPYVAVASHEGLLVNQHLGEARRLTVYERTQQGFREVETRDTPPKGGGDDRWRALAATLRDCYAVLVAHAGETPTRALQSDGIRVLSMEGLIEEGLAMVFAGQTPKTPYRPTTGCGAGCSGGGQGCG